MTQEVGLTRRLAGMLKVRLPELELAKVKDPRSARGKRWALESLLKATLVGMVAGCKSLAETEALTAELSVGMRRLLGLPRRVPDTTLRDLLEDLDPRELRYSMHAQVKAAHRRKALTPDGLPFGVLAMDGKSVTTDSWDGKYGQRHRHSEDQEAVGLIRTMTCALVSSKVKVCVDAIPIRASTNEMGQFRASLNALVQAYGRLGLFQLISYDAGGCSEENADAIIEKKLDYLFAIKDSQPGIRAELERLLGQRPTEKAEATTVDTLSNRKTVTRRLYLIAKQPLYRWSHARTFLRVESETLESGRVTAYENRYFICSLESTRLTMDQWLLVVRRHWNVENQCHHTWDTAFEEDAHPWMRSHPRAIVVLKLLRRMAYNLLALFRGMTQRSDERRQTPWKTIIRWTRNALIAATEVQLRRLLPEGNAVRS